MLSKDPIRVLFVRLSKPMSIVLEAVEKWPINPKFDYIPSKNLSQAFPEVQNERR
jgi:hypothetical protein